MRKLVAALACRNNGSRLYGKPLQNLNIEKQVSILDHLISLIQTIDEIDEIVLGISEGSSNASFVEYAKKNNIKYILGDEVDVLQRLIKCVEKVKGTDAFRITTESPFFYYEKVYAAWQKHLTNNNDLTTLSGLPAGSSFQLLKLDALKKSHELGDNRHRSERCGLYIREHINDFNVEVFTVSEILKRYDDLRLTVDYPEDLIVCREVYSRFKNNIPRIPLEKIIDFLDSRPDLRKLVEPYLTDKVIWSGKEEKLI